MRAIAWLLRVFCYLFHMILSLTLLAVGVVAVHSNVHDMKLEMLPWQGPELNHWVMGLGLVGLLSVIFAITGWIRWLLPLWSIYVLGMLLKGIFFTSAVSFSGREDFHNWLLLTAGAILALIGSVSMLSKRRPY